MHILYFTMTVTIFAMPLQRTLILPFPFFFALMIPRFVTFKIFLLTDAYLTAATGTAFTLILAYLTFFILIFFVTVKVGFFTVTKQ